jgi:hypothetical protein
MISKSLSTSEKFAALYPLAEDFAEFCQLLYVMLIPHSDDFGREQGEVQTVKLLVLPGNPRPLEDFERALDYLDTVGLVRWYTAHGHKYLQIVDFEGHQTGLHKRTASKFPEVVGSTRPREEKRTELNRTKEGARTGPPFDVWLRELVEAYPEQGRTNSHLTETAFLTVFERDQRDPAVVYAELREALDNHISSYQWRVKGMVSRLDNWLRNGKYAQRLSEDGPASHSDKTPAWLRKAKAATP